MAREVAGAHQLLTGGQGCGARTDAPSTDAILIDTGAEANLGEASEGWWRRRPVSAVFTALTLTTASGAVMGGGQGRSAYP
jgi:hypothetical protein